MIEQEGEPKKYKRKIKGRQKQKITRNSAWEKLRLEKVVASKHLRLAMETEEERRARLENDAIYVYKYGVGICDDKG